MKTHFRGAKGDYRFARRLQFAGARLTLSSVDIEPFLLLH